MNNLQILCKFPQCTKIRWLMEYTDTKCQCFCVVVTIVLLHHSHPNYITPKISCIAFEVFAKKCQRGGRPMLS